MGDRRFPCLARSAEPDPERDDGQSPSRTLPLADHGDGAQVTALVERLLREGTGADRQRRAFADGGLRGVLDLLVRETVAT